MRFLLLLHDDVAMTLVSLFFFPFSFSFALSFAPLCSLKINGFEMWNYGLALRLCGNFRLPRFLFFIFFFSFLRFLEP